MLSRNKQCICTQIVLLSNKEPLPFKSYLNFKILETLYNLYLILPGKTLKTGPLTISEFFLIESNGFMLY